MSRFINIILIALGVFGLVFTWTYYYVKILWIAYVVGLGLAFVAGVTLFWISRSNKTRKEKKQEDKKKVEKLGIVDKAIVASATEPVEILEKAVAALSLIHI